MLKANCQPVRVSQFFKRKRLQKGKAMYLSQAREGLRQFYFFSTKESGTGLNDPPLGHSLFSNSNAIRFSSSLSFSIK